jgi:hypothetical protein
VEFGLLYRAFQEYLICLKKGQRLSGSILYGLSAGGGLFVSKEKNGLAGVFWIVNRILREALKKRINTADFLLNKVSLQ